MENVNEDEIDLLDLFGYILNWAWLIIICGMVTGVAALLISMYAMTPMYESTTTIYVLSKQHDATVTSSDLQVGTQLVKDYRQMIKSRTVLEYVIAECGLTDTYESLAGRVEVVSPSDTRMISITVTDPSPVKAKEIVDAIRIVASERIVSVMDIQAVNVVDEGNIAEKPSSPQKKKITLIGIALGVVACGGILVLIHLLDDSIKTTDDVERYLELSTLASIPLSKEEKKAKGRGRRKPVRRNNHGLQNRPGASGNAGQPSEERG